MTRRVGFAAALVGLFCGTAVFRFIALSGGFTNDQFLHLAAAQQMLFGEWPTRDFLDPGMPLMYTVSALAQRMLGHTLFAEAVLVASAFGLAAVFTALTVHQLTGARGLALIAALMEVAAAPRAYGYPKILTYAVTFFLLQRYAARPTPGRLTALAAAIVGSFLFRHDHGIYLAAAAAIGVFVAEPTAARGTRRVGQLAAIGTALAAPYLLYVQMNAGLWTYLQRGLEFRTREFERAEYVSPALFNGSQLDLQAALLYSYWALPLATFVVLAVLAWRRPDWRALAARIAPVAVVAVLLNIAFTRPPYHSRLPDAIVPAVILGAWLAWMAWQAPRRWAWRALAVAGGILFWVSITSTPQVDQFERARVPDALADFPRSIRESYARLVLPHDPRMLPSAAAALIPFYDYAARCLAPGQRVLVAGIIPEAVYFTHRAFAGGRSIFVAGYYDDESFQRMAMSKLPGEDVPFVLIHGAERDSFHASYPLVSRYVRSRFEAIATVGDGDPSGTVDLLIDRRLLSAGRDAETGWPCATAVKS